MMMLKIAWRNLWRNKRRTLLVICSIVVGISSTLVYDTFGRGLMLQMLNNQINTHYSHIQIHKKGYNDNKIVQNFIEHPDSVENVLKSDKNIKHYSERTMVYGLIKYASNSSGIYLVGIEPDKEKEITVIKSNIIRGRYLSDVNNEIVISKKLADKLEVDTGNNVVVMVNTLQGPIGMESFVITGIYQSANSEFDKMYVYIPLNSSQQLLGIGSSIHEFAIILNDLKLLPVVEKNLESKLNSNTEILNYKELIPIIASYIDMYDEMMIIFYLIIGVAVMFGSSNAMLMSVIERIREFGVLMSIGMSNWKIFRMILVEALIMGLIGTIAGFLIGYLVYLPLSYTGIDFSFYAESLESWGAGSIMYPVLEIGSILNSILVVPVAILFGAVYAARKAIKLQPTEALRYV
jgi:putative ABC transport system permease protein